MCNLKKSAKQATQRASIFILFICSTCIANAQQENLNGDQSFVVTNVHVIPMDSDRVLTDQTVIVRNGRISKIGKAGDIAVPDKLRRIEGNNRYLMPGLADLHVHLGEKDEYINYLSWGVTTVMHMGGSESRGRELLEHRQQIASGEIPGPRLYFTDRTLDGDPPAAGGAFRLSSPKAAREKVADTKAQGFDFIKIYNNVSLEVFGAIVDEAAKQGLPVFGHIPRKFDALTALQNGQNAVVHTEEFFFTLFEGPRSTENMDLGYQPDLSKIPGLVKTLAIHHVAVMPDLSFTFTNMLMWDDLDHIWNDPEIRYQYPNTVFDWRTANINRREHIENFIVRGQWKYELMQELTRQFQKGGILQVIGTDAHLPGLFPGKAAHRELAELVKAGLGNFDALAIGTRNAGEFVQRYINKNTRFGRIAEGYQADMILLENNPLDDVRNAKEISAVAANGRWYEKDQLDALRQELASRYKKQNDLNAEVDDALQGKYPKNDLHLVLQKHENDGAVLQSIEQRINSAGYAAAFKDDMELAHKILTLGVQLFPLSPNAWDSLAEIVLYMGDGKKAIEYYEQALIVDPEFSNARNQLESIRKNGVKQGPNN